jgi:hypothetical protein
MIKKPEQEQKLYIFKKGEGMKKYNKIKVISLSTTAAYSNLQSLQT